jgi:hypothetical protein
MNVEETMSQTRERGDGSLFSPFAPRVALEFVELAGGRPLRTDLG